MAFREGNRTHRDILAFQVVHNILPPQTQIPPTYLYVIMGRPDQLSHIRDAQNVDQGKFLSINIFQYSKCSKAVVYLHRKGKPAPARSEFLALLVLELRSPYV
jgi:hypothetical protein